MGTQKNSQNDTLAAIASLLALVLPFIQFFFKELPAAITGIFINHDLFFATSLITFLLSTFIILAYKVNPYFRVTPLWWQIKPYSEYLDKIRNLKTQEEIDQIPSVKPPLAITDRTIAFILIIYVAVAGFFFIKLGINFKDVENLSVAYLQAVIYTSVFVSSIFILLVYTRVLLETDQWKRMMSERNNKAISLAIAHNSFQEFPPIQFNYSHEERRIFPPSFVVGISIRDKKYEIYTDINAEVLYRVFEIK